MAKIKIKKSAPATTNSTKAVEAPKTATKKVVVKKSVKKPAPAVQEEPAELETRMITATDQKILDAVIPGLYEDNTSDVTAKDIVKAVKLKLEIVNDSISRLTLGGIIMLDKKTGAISLTEDAAFLNPESGAEPTVFTVSVIGKKITAPVAKSTTAKTAPAKKAELPEGAKYMKSGVEYSFYDYQYNDKIEFYLKGVDRAVGTFQGFKKNSASPNGYVKIAHGDKVLERAPGRVILSPSAIKHGNADERVITPEEHAQMKKNVSDTPAPKVAKKATIEAPAKKKVVVSKKVEAPAAPAKKKVVIKKKVAK